MYPPYHRNFFDGRSPQCNQVLFAQKVHAEGPYSAHAPRESPTNSAITNAICLMPGAQAVIVRPVKPNLENGKSARAGMRLSFFSLFASDTHFFPRLEAIDIKSSNYDPCYGRKAIKQRRSYKLPSPHKASLGVFAESNICHHA